MRIDTLRRGRDFDVLICAIPKEPLRTICADIAAHDDRWKAMLDRIETTQTMSV